MKDAHVFITGGSSGIGLALAQEFLRAGARTVDIAARGIERLDAARSLLEGIVVASAASSSSAASPAKDVPRVTRYQVDLEDPESITTAIQLAETESGPIDYLICCAGSAHPGHCIDQVIRTE